MEIDEELCVKIMVDQKQLENVESFKYLGSCLKNNQHDVTCGLSFIFMGSRHLFSTCFELPESSKHVENK